MMTRPQWLSLGHRINLGSIVYPTGPSMACSWSTPPHSLGSSTKLDSVRKLPLHLPKSSQPGLHAACALLWTPTQLSTVACVTRLSVSLCVSLQAVGPRQAVTLHSCAPSVWSRPGITRPPVNAGTKKSPTFYCATNIWLPVPLLESLHGLSLVCPFWEARDISCKHTDYCFWEEVTSYSTGEGGMESYLADLWQGHPLFPLGYHVHLLKAWSVQESLEAPSSRFNIPHPWWKKGQAPDLNSANGSIYPGTLESLK